MITPKLNENFEPIKMPKIKEQKIPAKKVSLNDIKEHIVHPEHKPAYSR